MLEAEKKEQRNLMWAMILVIGVLMLFNRLTTRPTDPMTETISEPVVAEVASAEPVIESAVVRTDIPVSNNRMSGLMTSTGDVTALDLTTYRQTTEPDSPHVTLLGPDYQADLVWSDLMTGAPVITGDKLTPKTPVQLVWTRGDLTLTRQIRVDDNYLMTFTDTIENRGNTATTTNLKGTIWRLTDSVTDQRSTVHEGFLGLFDNKEAEERYTAITPDKPFHTDNKGGWIGMTDKYWQTIWIPDQQVSARMSFEQAGDRYVASFDTPVTVRGGETVKRETRLFAGAKELDLINAYEAAGIPRFDLSIDFGWYYFLTKPFLYFLGWLYQLVGNMGIAILIFATLIRIALLPIATKSYESMAKMKKIQPKIQALQERFKDNRQQLQIELMNLYKRDKVNPASGCLPMLIQIPVFFALYKVLSVSILMRQAPFFGWITDLSQRDSSSILTAFGYLPWPIPSFLDIGVLAVLMGLTMVIQQKMNPSVGASKDQKTMMTLMPIVFTFMLGNFASGLVNRKYLLFSSVLTWLCLLPRRRYSFLWVPRSSVFRNSRSLLMSATLV